MGYYVTIPIPEHVLGGRPKLNGCVLRKVTLVYIFLKTFDIVLVKFVRQNLTNHHFGVGGCYMGEEGYRTTAIRIIPPIFLTYRAKDLLNSLLIDVDFEGIAEC